MPAPSAVPVFKHGIIFLAFVLLLAGCASTPAVFNPEPVSAADAVVYIYRPDTLANTLVSPPLKVDNTALFTVHNDRYYSLRLAPGTHRLQLELAEFYQGEFETSIEVEAGESYFIRVDTTLTFQQNRPYTRRFDLLQIPAAVALNEIGHCTSANAEAAAKPVAAPDTTAKPPGYSSQIFRNPFAH